MYKKSLLSSEALKRLRLSSVQRFFPSVVRSREPGDVCEERGLKKRWKNAD